MKKNLLQGQIDLMLSVLTVFIFILKKSSSHPAVGEPWTKKARRMEATHRGGESCDQGNGGPRSPT